MDGKGCEWIFQCDVLNRKRGTRCRKTPIFKGSFCQTCSVKFGAIVDSDRFKRPLRYRTPIINATTDHQD